VNSHRGTPNKTLVRSYEKENATDDNSLSAYDDPTPGGGRLARIQFSLKYLDSTLTLKVMRAVDLPIMDHLTATSDPYVKVLLLIFIKYQILILIFNEHVYNAQL